MRRTRKWVLVLLDQKTHPCPNWPFSVLNPKMVQPDIEVPVLSKDIDEVRRGRGLNNGLRNPGWHPNPGHWSPST